MRIDNLHRAALGAVLALSLPLASAASLSGEQIVTQGNGKGAMACAGCHGSDGAGNDGAGFPRLAGLQADYLQKQLHDFKSGQRSNAIMNGVAKALSDEEIHSVAQHFASLRTAGTQTTADAALLAQGEKLAKRGNWDKDVPACFRCHGDLALGGGPAMPALAGQHASYIQNQLQAWKHAQRSNDPVGLMSAIAVRLSDAEIQALATYLASLNPAAAK